MNNDGDFCIDGVREVLDVAVDVLRDYAPDEGNSRIERLARFVLLNVRADVTADGTLFDDSTLTAEQCREVATYWLLLAERADRVC